MNFSTAGKILGVTAAVVVGVAALPALGVAFGTTGALAGVVGFLGQSALWAPVSTAVGGLVTTLGTSSVAVGLSTAAAAVGAFFVGKFGGNIADAAVGSFSHRPSNSPSTPAYEQESESMARSETVRRAPPQQEQSSSLRPDTTPGNAQREVKTAQEEAPKGTGQREEGGFQERLARARTEGEVARGIA